jgi:N-acetylneuraminate synthase/sialic acid synthase
LQIGSDRIDDDSDCWVIAEIGHNHQGDVDKARKLFWQAKQCGANAVKLQKRDNRTLFTREAFERPYENENSFGPTYGAHREALEFGWSEYQDLQQYAAELEITFFATPFDRPSADFLEKLDVPVYKIASGDLRNLPLLRHVAAFGKPIILSTGGGTLDDVRRAYDAVAPINPQLAILQCTASYPAAFDELNLRVIQTYRTAFPDCVVGFSGHDNGIAMAVVAYMLGARIVEKHFTLNRAWKGTDHPFSLEPQGLQKMVRDLRRTRLALGSPAKTCLPSEVSAVQKMGKKLVAARALPVGHVLTEVDVAVKSPGDGLSPFELPNLLGLTVQRALEADEDLTLDVFAPVNGLLSAQRV